MSVDISIVVDLDSVTIEGVVVKRPPPMSRSTWTAFWDDVIHFMKCGVWRE
jgi:hypothetical protein